MMKYLYCFLELLVLLILWFLSIGIIAGIPIYIIATANSISETEMLDNLMQHPWLALIFNILSVVATLFAVYLFYAMFGGKVKDLGFSLRGRVKDFGWGALYGTGTMLLGFLVLLTFGIITIEWGSTALADILIFLPIFFCVAVMEEALSRGAMINICLKHSNKAVALIVSSLIFAVMHIMNTGISWIGCCNLLLAGLFMGMYYIYQRNLWFPIALHLTWNFVQGPVLGFAVSGTTTPQMIIQHPNGAALWTGGEFGFEGSLVGVIILCAATIAVYFHFRRKPAPIPIPLSIFPESSVQSPPEAPDYP